MSNSPLPLADVLGHEATDKRIDILRRIGEVGSISEAARGAGVSYKAAWQALETLTNLAGVPLVEKVVGGTGGGGAALTPAGQRVLQAAHALAAARQQVLSRLHSDDDAATGRAALALRTSMRNQFPCTVGKVRAVGGQVRVQLLLADGQALHASITRVSAQLLDLKAGLVCWRCARRRRFRWPRTLAVPQAMPWPGWCGCGPGRCPEVVLQLPSGIQLVGFAAAGSKVRTGQQATAVF
ncbi:MAG: LysR family transcriptional regulator [Paenacidovorax caeni]